MGGIDIAAHDAMGKLLNLSVADLIGGSSTRARAGLCVGRLLHRKRTTKMAHSRSSSSAMPARGFTAFKIKIGRHPAEDAARVTLARRIIGETPLLTVDTNGNYTEDGVLESMRHTVPFDVHWSRGTTRATGLGRLRRVLKSRAPGVPGDRRGAVPRVRLPPG